MHNLLRLQIKRHLAEGFAASPELGRFFDAVATAYQEFDEERSMLMRSLDLSSGELLEANAGLRKAVQALEQEKERFHYVALATHDAIYDWDIRTGRMWGNEACQVLYSANLPSDLDRSGWEQRIHPDDRGRILDGIREAFAQRRPLWSTQFRFRRGDGAYAELIDRGYIIYDGTGQPVREIGAMTDMTEHKRLEEQIRQAQKMEAIGTLAGGIAHDFNNILYAIVGYTQLAQMSLPENAVTREYLVAVLQAANRATDLVRQILTFSRQQHHERQSIKLLPVVAESIKLLRATIPSTIQFDTSLAMDAPTVLADATQIHQILMNIGINASYAMKDRNGRLQMRLEPWVVDTAHATTQPQLRPGVYARVSISDTGCGMDQATLQRIFEPFFTTKPPGEGTGLGLAIVHGIMKDHNGAVTVYSQPGEGTIFHLYFPAYTGETTVAAVEKGPVPLGHGERILFVDDEELLVGLGQEVLTSLGYEVEITTQPAVALTMVQTDPQRFALVVTDQTMPGMTGFALASQLLKIRPGLPILLMTGYSVSITAEKVAAAGIRQLLRKPATIHMLGTAVHAALSSKPSQ